MAHPSSPPPPPPPWPPAQPQPRNHRPLIIALAIGVPVLLLIVVVSVLVGGGDDDSDGPNEVAERFLDAINSGDAASAEAELCEHGASLLPASVDEIIASEPAVDLTTPLEDRVPEMAGGDGSGLEGSIGEDPATGQIFVAQVDDDSPWCVQSFMIVPDTEL